MMTSFLKMPKIEPEHQVFCTPLEHPSLPLGYRLCSTEVSWLCLCTSVPIVASVCAQTRAWASWGGRYTVFSIGRHKFLPECVKFWWPCLLLLCSPLFYSALQLSKVCICLWQHFSLLACYKFVLNTYGALNFVTREITQVTIHSS